MATGLYDNLPSSSASAGERCPFCRAPFNFHCFDLGRPLANRIIPVSVCGACGEDVRISQKPQSPSESRVSRYERALYVASLRGKCKVKGCGWIYSGALFEVLHHLIGRCRNSRRIRCLRDEGTDRGRLFPMQDEDIPTGSFPIWDIASRHRAMCGFATLLADWPAHFIESARRFGVTSYEFRGDNKELPYWFDSVVLTHFCRKWWSPSDEEVTSVRELIRSAGEAASFYNVRRWLGLFYDKKNKKKKYVLHWLEKDRPEQLRLKMSRFNCFGKHTEC